MPELCPSEFNSVRSGVDFWGQSVYAVSRNQDRGLRRVTGHPLRSDSLPYPVERAGCFESLHERRALKTQRVETVGVIRYGQPK